MQRDRTDRIISGMGELHLEILVLRIASVGEFKVEAKVGTRRWPSATLTQVVEQDYKHVKQTGGHEQYGHVKLRVHAQRTRPGLRLFATRWSAGQSRASSFPRSKRECVTRASAGQHQVQLVDVKVTLYDGSYHDVNSSSAFELAGSLCFFARELRRAHPILLEPNP